MDQAALVKDRIRGGEKLLRRLREGGFDVVAACWAKTETDDQPYLYIVSPSVALKGALQGITRIRLTLEGMDGEWVDEFEQIDSMDTKLVAPTNSLARGLIDFAGRSADVRPTWHSDTVLGGAYVESAYIYPAAMFDRQPATAVSAAGN